MPRLMRAGGLTTHPAPTTVQRPMLMALAAEEGADLPSADVSEDLKRCRSPRRCTSAIMTVRPPRVMLAVPEIWARRETLLPESWEGAG